MAASEADRLKQLRGVKSKGDTGDVKPGDWLEELAKSLKVYVHPADFDLFIDGVLKLIEDYRLLEKSRDHRKTLEIDMAAHHYELQEEARKLREVVGQQHEALLWASQMLEARDIMNAKVHCAPVSLSPITERVQMALKRGEELKK